MHRDRSQPRAIDRVRGSCDNSQGMIMYGTASEVCDRRVRPTTVGPAHTVLYSEMRQLGRTHAAALGLDTRKCTLSSKFS